MLVAQHLERAADAQARAARRDHLVDIAPLRRHERIGEARLIFVDALLDLLLVAELGAALEVKRNDAITLDEIEDLRIAVDEACAMLLPHAIDTAQLSCRFRLDPSTLEVTVTIPTTRGQLPERDTFSWTVLSALAGEVDTGLDDERRVWIRLRKRRSAGVA